MPWSSLFAKCTWWCCRMVMGALTTIQWALNTKCFKYWAAWQTEPAGSHWNVRAGLCLMFSNPSHIPLQLSCLQRVPKSWSFLIWKLCCPLNQLCKTFCSHLYVPFRYGDKICTCNSEKWAHTFLQCLGPLLKSMQVLWSCFGCRAQPEAFLSRLVLCAMEGWNEQVRRRQNDAILYNLNHKTVGYGFLAWCVLKGQLQQNFLSWALPMEMEMEIFPVSSAMEAVGSSTAHRGNGFSSSGSCEGK